MKEQKAKGAPSACAPGAGAADSRADANEYTQIVRNSSNQNPAHDKNGNMTTLPTRPATGTAAGTNVSTAITFDAFNRPFTAQAGGNGVQDYRYDALGRRIAAMELSGGNILAGRRFVWDSWSVATERLLSGTTGNCDSLLERCYVEGASLDEHLFAAIDGDLDGSLSTNLNVPVSASTSNTNDYEYYYLQNRLGSVMGLLDATDDRYMLEYYRYTVYGEATVLPLYDTGLNQIEDTPTDLSDNNSAMLATRTGGGGDATAGRASTFNNQYTFTGRYLDAETGLHYFRYRYYESRTGRFISRDPAETPWENLYSYCENSPTNKLDPYGLKSEAYNQQMKRWIAMISENWVYPHKRGGLDKIDDLCKKLSGAMDWIFRNSDGSDWFVQAEQMLHDVWVDRCQRKMSVYQEQASDHIEIVHRSLPFNLDDLSHHWIEIRNTRFVGSTNTQSMGWYVHSGTERINAFATGTPGQVNRGEIADPAAKKTHGETASTTLSRDPNRKMQHGRWAGKSCKDIQHMNQAADCLRAFAKQYGPNYCITLLGPLAGRDTGNNCHRFAKLALEQCCLDR